MNMELVDDLFKLNMASDFKSVKPILERYGYKQFGERELLELQRDLTLQLCCKLIIANAEPPKSFKERYEDAHPFNAIEKLEVVKADIDRILDKILWMLYANDDATIEKGEKLTKELYKLTKKKGVYIEQ